MALNIFETVDIIEVVENFIEKIRPPETIRDEFDISYNIDDQSVTIVEIRKSFVKESMMEIPVAKATFVKAQNCWKVFWHRASGAWDSYKPMPKVKTIRAFCALVEEDKMGCFWG